MLRASNAGESLTFAIVGGNSNGAFSIDTSTGRLTVADESKTTGLVSFNLTIAVRDAGIDGPISWAYTGVNVTTTLLSRPPVVAPYNFSIPELSPAGTPLGIVTAYSLNNNRTLTYSLLPLGYYPTFPFSVTTIPSQSGTTLAATGAIAVASGMTVNTYSQGPRLYLATLSVQDNDPVSNFVAQSLVAINVSYVPRPPYFNAVTQTPASAWFQLEVNELSSVGTPVVPPAGGLGPIAAYSKDAWAVLTYSILVEAPGCSGCFVIDNATASVMLGPNGGALNFNTASSYNLTVRAFYSLIGMSDTASVTVWIREINKPAVWTGLYNMSGVLAATVSISEAAPPGTQIGRILFTDPNTGHPWNTRAYALQLQGPGAQFFALDQNTGVLSVGVVPLGTNGLVFWDYPSFSLNVSCYDLSPAPLTTSQTITVVITPVNTMAITGFGLPLSTDPSAGITLSPGAIAFTTIGNTTIEIYGRGFGPTQRRLNESASSAVAVTASYGPYTATGCAVYVPNTVIRCTTTAGVGAGHAWTVALNGGSLWSATSAAIAGNASTTSYMAPTITGVNKWTGSAYALSNLLLTNGGESVIIDGANLAASVSDPIGWSYGPTGVEYGGGVSSCQYKALGTQVICTS